MLPSKWSVDRPDELPYRLISDSFYYTTGIDPTTSTVAERNDFFKKALVAFQHSPSIFRAEGKINFTALDDDTRKYTLFTLKVIIQGIFNEID